MPRTVSVPENRVGEHPWTGPIQDPKLSIIPEIIEHGVPRLLLGLTRLARGSQRLESTLPLVRPGSGSPCDLDDPGDGVD